MVITTTTTTRICDVCQSPDDIEVYAYPQEGGTTELCPECASKEGFCPGCGSFVGGSEYDEYCLGFQGLCSECLEELKEELGEHYECDPNLIFEF